MSAVRTTTTTTKTTSLLRLVLCVAATAAGAATQDVSEFENNRVVEAYPCNPLTHERQEIHLYVNDTDEIPLTICVGLVGKQADGDENENNMVLEGIEDFRWTKNIPGVVQVAIDDGMPSSDGSTVIHDCPPNSLVCSFHTTLGSDYYKMEGAILGEGTIRLERRSSDATATTRIEPLQRRALAKASIGVQVPVDKAPDTDRPPLKNAAGARLVPNKHLIASMLGAFGAWIVLVGM